MNEDDPMERMWNAPQPSFEELLEQQRQATNKRLEAERAAGIVRLTDTQFRIGDFLLRHPEEVHSVEQLSRGVNCSTTAARNSLQRLEGYNIVEQAANASSYQLIAPQRLRETLVMEARRRLELSDKLGGYLPSGFDEILLRSYAGPEIG